MHRLIILTSCILVLAFTPPLRAKDTTPSTAIENVTVDDPKFYTEPFQFLTADFYWMKDQVFAETFCIPSEGIQYRDRLAAPSGIEIIQ